MNGAKMRLERSRRAITRFHHVLGRRRARAQWMVGTRSRWYLVFVLVARRSARFSGPCVATDPGYRGSRVARCITHRILCVCGSWITNEDCDVLRERSRTCNAMPRSIVIHDTRDIALAFDLISFRYLPGQTTCCAANCFIRGNAWTGMSRNGWEVIILDSASARIWPVIVNDVDVLAGGWRIRKRLSSPMAGCWLLHGIRFVSISLC